MRSKFLIWVLLSIWIGLLGSLEVQAAAGDPQLERTLQLSSDRGDYDEDQKLVRLIGNVKLTYGDVVMYSSFAKYHTDTQIAEFQGEIRLEQPGTTMTAQGLRVYYAQKRAVLRGQVRVVSERLPGTKEKAEGPSVPAYLEAQELEYYWEKGLGQAQGQIEFRQGEKRLFADRATYDRQANKVELLDNVRLERGQGDWLASNKVSVDLTTNDIEASGQVMGRFVVGKPEEESKGQAAWPSARALEPNSAPAPQTVERWDPLLYPNL